MQLIMTFCILGVSILLFMSNRVRADLVAILALLALTLTGILNPTEAFAGFSNAVVIMIAGLFIIGAGLLRTGLAGIVGNLLLRWSNNSELKLFVLLLMIVAFVGSFMSNTGTVALMLPIVVGIAMKMKHSPSRFLIPLSYISSLAGLLTLIATPPNMIVSQALVDHGFERLGFFDITPVGIIAVFVGIVYLVLVRDVLLPKGDYKEKIENGYRLSPKNLATDYELGGKLFRITVPSHSAIVGRQLSKLKLPSIYQICILKIERKSSEGLNLLPMTFQEMAGPNSIIKNQDVLYVLGSYQQLEKFITDYSLALEKESETEQLVTSKLGIAEVLLTPHSSLIGDSVAKINFREKYNLNIIAINRKGDYVLDNMSEVRLRFGDALLVQGSWDEIELLAKETKDVVVIGQPQEQASIAKANGKALIAGLIMLSMILLMIFNVVPAVISVLLAAILMIVTGCLRNMDDAYSKINWESIVLIACMLPMATALEKTGGVELISEGLIQVLGDYGSLGVLAGIYLLTMLFGQFISNTATAVLFSPIAMNAAIMLDANPYTYLIAVAAASSMAFATPVASPTNALVMTAGEYKFSDFLRIGIPLQIVMFIVMMIVIPLFFPL